MMSMSFEEKCSLMMPALAENSMAARLVEGLKIRSRSSPLYQSTEIAILYESSFHQIMVSLLRRLVTGLKQRELLRVKSFPTD
jgi:hypothetical protein